MSILALIVTLVPAAAWLVFIVFATCKMSTVFRDIERRQAATKKHLDETKHLREFGVPGSAEAWRKADQYMAVDHAKHWQQMDEVNRYQILVPIASLVAILATYAAVPLARAIDDRHQQQQRTAK